MLYQLTKAEQSQLMDAWCEATTAGTWRAEDGDVLACNEALGTTEYLGKFVRPDDAAFAAMAWNWTSQLLCYVEELEAELKVSQALTNHYKTVYTRLFNALTGGATTSRFAVIQLGYAMLGEGATEEEALAQARCEAAPYRPGTHAEGDVVLTSDPDLIREYDEETSDGP